VQGEQGQHAWQRRHDQILQQGQWGTGHRGPPAPSAQRAAGPPRAPRIAASYRSAPLYIAGGAARAAGGGACRILVETYT
jgi:hypothetical protein